MMCMCSVRYISVELEKRKNIHIIGVIFMYFSKIVLLQNGEHSNSRTCKISLCTIPSTLNITSYTIKMNIDGTSFLG